MKKILFAILVILLNGFLANSAMAQAKIVRGEGTISVQRPGSTGPNDEERNAAFRTAKLNAWRAYLAMPGQNETVDQIRVNEKLFLDRLDDLLVDIVTVEENFNKETNRYTIRIKATVAESQVGSLLRNIAKGGAQGGSPGVASAIGSAPIMVLGLSREADVVKSYLEKQTNVSESSSDSESTKTKSVNSATVRTKEVTGGNVERKRDKVTFRVGNVGILNSKLPRFLLQNGIKSSPYSFLMAPCRLPNPDNFSKQYASSDAGELPSKVMADIQEKLATCGRVKYWVFASMDVGGYGSDPNTGMALATVSVNVQLFEVETGAQLASATKDVSGRAADQSDAIRSASDSAVQAVGDIITAQVAGLK